MHIMLKAANAQVLQFIRPSFAASLRQVVVLLYCVFLSRAVAREVAVMRDIDMVQRDGNAS